MPVRPGEIERTPPWTCCRAPPDCYTPQARWRAYGGNMRYWRWLGAGLLVALFSACRTIDLPAMDPSLPSLHVEDLLAPTASSANTPAPARTASRRRAADRRATDQAWQPPGCRTPGAALDRRPPVVAATCHRPGLVRATPHRHGSRPSSCRAWRARVRGSLHVRSGSAPAHCQRSCRPDAASRQTCSDQVDHPGRHRAARLVG